MKIRGIEADHSLFPNKSKKRWTLKRKDAAGKWFTTDAPAEIKPHQQGAAEAWARALLLAPSVAPSPAPSAAPPAPAAPQDTRTLNDFFPVWEEILKARPKVSEDTRTRYLSILRADILPLIGGKRFAEIDVPTCCAVVRSLAGRLAPLTAGLVRGKLALYLDDAQSAGWLPLGHNPARHKLVQQELPKQKRLSGRVVIHLPAEHAQALISDPRLPLKRRFRYFVAFSVGLRDGELAALRRHRFRLDAPIPQVDVHRSISARTLKDKTTKNEASERTLPLAAAQVATFRWWFAEGFELAYGRGPLVGEGLLFVGPRGGPTRPESAEQLRADLALLGLPTTHKGFPITFHAARRSLATWLHAAGGDDATIGDLLGHEGETITHRVYTDADLARMQGVIERQPLRWPLGADLGADETGTSTTGHANPATSQEDFGNDAGGGWFESNRWGARGGGKNGRNRVIVPGFPVLRVVGVRGEVESAQGIGTTTAPAVERADWLPDAPKAPTPAAVQIVRRALRRRVA